MNSTIWRNIKNYLNKMQKYKEFFKNKKITIMGLGLLGGALNDAIFLSEAGAVLTITDLKNEIQLKHSLDKLKKYKDIKYVLGRHDLEDFKKADFIIEPGNVPLNSVYIKEAEKNNIPIHTSESLFCQFAKGVKVLGVTGTRGKTMTTMLIYEILSKTLKNKKVYLGGNIRNTSALALLKKVKEGDVVVLELDSWTLSALGEIKYSPHISVFTSFMEDHMNYYTGAGLSKNEAMKEYFSDKANIFKYQNKEDFLIINPNLNKLINKNSTKAELIKGSIKEVENFKFIVPGEHQKMNLALAYQVAKLFGIKDNQIKKVLKDFKGVEGRLQFLREYKGIKIFNDNNATTPEATIAGINAFNLKKNQKLILITGGTTKNINLTNFAKNINQKVDKLYLISGTGTEELLNFKLKPEVVKIENFKDIIIEAIKNAKKGDIVLFSPAFASFGMFNNEYDRNDQFVKIIKGLK